MEFPDGSAPSQETGHLSNRDEGLDGEPDLSVEAQPAKALVIPVKPTQAMEQEHNLSHLPCRAWCPVCVRVVVFFFTPHMKLGDRNMQRKFEMAVESIKNELHL